MKEKEVPIERFVLFAVFFIGIILLLVQSVSAQSNPTITNTGFENGFSGWSDSGASSSSQTHSGSNAAKLNHADEYIRQTVSVSPNTTYQLSAWIKNAGGVLGARDFGGSTVSTTSNVSGYAEYSITFTTGASATSVEIFGEHTDDNDIVFDDFTLVVTSTSNPGVTIQNPGFETSGYAGWTVDGVSNSSQSHSGSRAVKLNNSDEYVRQTVSVTPNTTYELSAWVKNAGGVLGARDFGGGTVSTTSNVSGYAEYSVTFTTGSLATTVEIFGEHSASNDVIFDDFELVALTSTTPVPPTSTSVAPTATSVPPTATSVPPTATPVPPTATPVPPTATPVPPSPTAPPANPLTNPGFENGFSGWSENDASSSSQTHSGSNAAKLNNSGEYLRQTVSVTPNTTYELSAWIKNAGGELGARNFGGSTVSTTSNVSGYAQYSVTFTTGSSATSVEIFGEYAGSGDVVFDDFALEPTTPPGPTATPTITPTVCTGCVTPTATPVPPTPTSVPGSVQYPYDVPAVDMSSFKLTLPIGRSSSNYPALEIERPELETYEHPHFFTLNQSKDAVVFMNTAGDCDLYYDDDEVWGRTSSGTNYARSELRELYDNGDSDDNIDEWDLLQGTHEMVIRQSIEELTFVQKKHAVVGQIHWESGSDLIMIRYEDYNGQKRLFVENNGRDHGWTLDPNYQIGDIFTVSIKVENASIIISYDNEVTNVSEVITMPSSMVLDQIESDSDNSLVYYKAGMYGQSSLLKIASEDPCSYAKTYMYSLSVTHN